MALKTYDFSADEMASFQWAKMTTSKGVIWLNLYNDETPNTVANFASLVNDGYYNGLSFHRVIPGFMAQGGDPDGTGMGGPGYALKAEFNDRKHVRGTLAMARTSDINSATSQFFINLVDTPGLTGKHTVFGEVVKGMDVVEALGGGDIIIKGANAVHLATRRAGVLIGHPQAGTIGAAAPAVIGRRVKLLVPVGLEKRVEDDIAELAEFLNEPGASGPTMFPIPGEFFTEWVAIDALSGASSPLVSAGGVCGAEGALWIAVTGGAAEVAAAESLIQSVAAEPPCRP